MMYVLDAKHNVLPEPDMQAWVEWYENADRTVKFHRVFDMKGGKLTEFEISTVFLGIDSGIGGSLAVFETMVFGGKLDGYQQRCSTWKKAEKQHEEVRVLVRNGGLATSCN